jgi:DNA-directed RNA polymerase sigma subunit (sigma70/sigma32)
MKSERLLGDSEYHMSFAEIAKELGVTRQTVRTIQERALRKIAYKLEGYRDYERADIAVDWFDGADDYPGDSGEE